MKGTAKGSFSVPLLLMILLVAHCRATAGMNNDTRRCNGPLHECDLESELLVDTEINTRLALAPGNSVTKTTIQHPDKPAITCGRKKPYKKCLPPGNHCPDPFNRNCPHTSPTASLQVAKTCSIYQRSGCTW